MRFTVRFAVAFLMLSTLHAQPAMKQPAPDDRFKADILLVLAHPDDESNIFPYLAKAIFDEKRRVAFVFMTNGGGGTNQVAAEMAESMGAVREIEARRALAGFGIHTVWFLSNKDVATQNVLSSLGAWDHGGSLEKVVRLIRLTRPEAVITFFPGVVAGENHGGHQAAGVIATEAFDLAGDPTVFPQQVSAPIHHYERELESLRPWQPKKLYFQSDASHASFMAGHGPQYRAEEISPSQKMPYWELGAREFAFHETQGGRAASEALKKNPHVIPEEWKWQDTGNADAYFILGKTLVKSEPADDIFAGITGGSLAFAPHKSYSAKQGPILQAGGPWAFYRDFWQVHDMEHLAGLLSPELEVSASAPFHVPLLITNDSDAAKEISLSVTLPDGWTEQSGSGKYALEPHGQRAVTFVLTAAPVKKPEWRELRYAASVNGQTTGAVTVRIHARPHEGPEWFEQ